MAKLPIPHVLVDTKPDIINAIVNSGANPAAIGGGLLFPYVNGEPMNILSFTHFNGMSEGSDTMGAKLEFIDPDGSFERKFFFNNSRNAFKAYSDNYASKGDSDSPQDASDHRYVTEVLGGGQSGGGVVDKEMSLWVAYGYPGNWSGVFLFGVFNGKISHNDGIKKIVLHLSAPIMVDLTDKERKVFPEGTSTQGAEITVAGNSDKIEIDSELAVEPHLPFKQAYLRFVKSSYNYDNIMVVIPDTVKVMKERLPDKQEILVNRSGPDHDRRGLARQVLEELYNELGAELVAVFVERKNTKGRPMGTGQQIMNFVEIEGAGSKEEALDKIHNRIENFVSISARTSPTTRWKELDEKMKEVVANMGRMLMNKYVSHWSFHIENEHSNLHRLSSAERGLDPNKPILIVGDAGLIEAMKGHANLTNVFNSQDQHLQGILDSGKSLDLKMNMGDSSNIIDLSYLEENWYLLNAGSSFSKPVESEATNHTPGKFKEENNATGSVTTGPQTASTPGTKVSSSEVRTVATKAVASPRVVFDDNSGETAANSMAKEIASAKSKWCTLKVTTLPIFKLSRGSDIGSPATVSGRDVAFAGISGGGKTSFYSGKYTVMGFKHTINTEGPRSEFRLTIRD